MKLQAVFFDMGGTIETMTYDEEMRRAATAQLLERLQAYDFVPALSVTELYRLLKRQLERYSTWKEATWVELPPPRVWQEFLLAQFSLPPERVAAVAEELAFFFETHFYQRALRPEVPAVLETLQGMGLKLGMISNVISRGLVPFNLRRYGIADTFDPVVLSSIYGRRKPDPFIFWHAARLAGVHPRQCVYVGDTISRDVFGARRAGYRLAIRIRNMPLDGPEERSATPDYVIDDMNELVAILQREISQPTAPPQRQPIKALLFDAGDLLYYRPHKGERLAAFLAERNLEPISLPEPEHMLLRRQAMTGQISQAAYLEMQLRSYGLHDEEDLAQCLQLIREDSAAVTFFDGVPETLHNLKKRGLMLGVVTDTYQSQRDKMNWFRQVGIDDVWDVYVASYEVGVRKPHPRIYYTALNQLGIAPEEAIFVGHRASELNGASALGMATVVFNPDPDASGDFMIDHFSELLDLPILLQARARQDSQS